jgi:hypothetical protein
LEFADTAPFQANATAVCQAPASAVFNVIKDNRRSPEWVGSGVTSVESTSDPDCGVGSTRTVTFPRFARVHAREGVHRLRSEVDSRSGV